MDDVDDFLRAINENPNDVGLALDTLINKRQVNAKALAERFPDLRGLSWVEFLARIDDLGLRLDFVTAHQMFEALKEPQEAKAERGSDHAHHGDRD